MNRVFNPISTYRIRKKRSRFVRRNDSRLRHNRFESLEQRLPMASNVLASVSEQLDFHTADQSMWEAGPELRDDGTLTGIMEDFSHTLVDIGTDPNSPETIGQIDQVTNPDRVAYDAFIGLCSSVPGVTVTDCQNVGLPGLPEPSTHISASIPNPLFAPWLACEALGFSLASCEFTLGAAPSRTINGSVPNPAYPLWEVAIDACELVGFTASECENGISVGSPPPATVESGAELTFNAAVEFGVRGDLEVGGGSVDVDYPTQIDVTIIGDAVEAGDVFTITTSEVVGNATMTTDFADIHASLNAFVNAQASANVKVRYPSLAPIPDISIGPTDLISPPLNANADLELIGLDVDDGVLDLRLLSVPVVTAEGIEQDFKYGKAALYIPDLDTTGTLNNGKIVNTQLPAMAVSPGGESDIDFAKATIDIDSVLTQGVGGTLPTFTIDNPVPTLDPLLTFDATLLNAEIGPFLGIGQEMTFTPTVMVQFNFDPPTLVQGGAAPVASVTIPVGQSLDLIHPGGDLEIEPVYTLQNTFQNKTDILLSPKFNYELLSYSIGGVIPELLDIDGGAAVLQDTIPLGDPTPIVSLTNGPAFEVEGFQTYTGSSLLVQASTASASGPASVDEYDAYTLDLAATGPVVDQIEEWTINWGDGNVETFSVSQPGVFDSPVHTYDEDGTFSIVATATYDSGQKSLAADAVPVSVVNADGDLTLRIDDLATPGLDVLIVDNMPAGTMTFSGQVTTAADALPNVGMISYSGSVGATPVVSAVVISDHSNSQPSLHLSASVWSMGAASLEFAATDVGYQLPAGSQQLTAAIGGNTDGHVDFLEEFDLANTEFADSGASASAQEAFGAGLFASEHDIDLVFSNHPFSITKTVQINHTGFGQLTALGSYGTADHDATLAPFKVALQALRDNSSKERLSRTPRMRYEPLAVNDRVSRPDRVQLQNGGNRVFADRVRASKHDQALVSVLDEADELL